MIDVSLLLAMDEAMAMSGMALKTRAEYRKYARRLLVWLGSRGGDPGAVTAVTVAEWGETVPASYSSRKFAKAAVRELVAVAGGDPDVAGAVRIPRKPRMQCRALSYHDARRLRGAAQLHGGRPGLAVLIGLYTGARAAEIAHMRWEDIDLQPQTVEDLDGNELEVDGIIEWTRVKGGGRAWLPLHAVLAEALEAAWIDRAGVAGHVFTGNNGRPHVSATTVWTWVKRVADIAEVTVTTHQLRHTLGATIVDETSDIRTAQDILGHVDPAVTAGYTRSLRRKMVAAMAAVPY